MVTRAHIIGDSPVVLWGISSRERLRRQFAALPDVEICDEPRELDGADSVLLLRADYLYEVRTLTALLARRGILTDGDVNAAAHVEPADAGAALTLLTTRADGHGTDRLERFGVDALRVYEGQLRRNDPPTLAALNEADREALSSRLYGSAYKGITDLVTKFWWPKPAKRAVAWCAERGITPNMVTLTGLVLMLLAGWCFYEGAYLTGLIAGWLMTFLDTVDGKLARVTVLSSRVGHWLDHGMDIVHPPFWYWLWGLGLATPPALWGFDATSLYVWLFIGYIGGRIAEALFHSLGELSLFAWRPFDAYFRLVTGRRNPCLILLTVATLVGAPDWGFYAVVVWTVASTAVLFVRYLQGLAVRQHSGQPLEPWMADPERAAREYPRAFRTFATTRSAYGNG
jgi:phosphatidylglycerophosphate synthase